MLRNPFRRRKKPPTTRYEGIHVGHLIVVILVALAACFALVQAAHYTIIVLVLVLALVIAALVFSGSR